MKLSKYAGITAVLGCAFAYGIVGCGGGSSDGGSSGGKGGSKSGGKGGSSSSGGKGGSSSGSGGSSAGGSGGSSAGGSGGDMAGQGGDAGGTPAPGGNTTISAAAAKLVGYWPFDGNTDDSSPNKNNGTAVKGSTENSPATTVAYAAGKKGMALSLTNPQKTADPVWIKVPPTPSIDSIGTEGAFSITSWVNPTSTDTDKFNFVISRQEVGTFYEHFGLGTSNGKPSASVHFFFAIAADTLPNGKWTHLAATYDAVTLTIYIDGVASTSLDVGWPISADTTPTIISGNQNESTVKESWDGLLDEVRLYSGVLTAAEIAADAK